MTTREEYEADLYGEYSDDDICEHGVHIWFNRTLNRWINDCEDCE